MAFKRFDGSSWVDPGSIKRWTGSAWEGVQTVKRWSGVAWDTVWTAMTVGITGFFNQQSAGSGRVFDNGTFSVYKLPSGGSAITAYAWDFTDYGGSLSLFGGTTGSSLNLRGPQYQQFGFNTQYTVIIWCTVTIDGKQYRTPDAEYTYYVDGAG